MHHKRNALAVPILQIAHFVRYLNLISNGILFFSYFKVQLFNEKYARRDSENLILPPKTPENNRQITLPIAVCIILQQYIDTLPNEKRQKENLDMRIFKRHCKPIRIYTQISKWRW